MAKTLKVFGTGQVTIPKEWRDKFSVNHFRATETEKGILLEPVEVYEEVIFDPPISAKELSRQIKKYRKKHDG